MESSSNFNLQNQLNSTIQNLQQIDNINNNEDVEELNEFLNEIKEILEELKFMAKNNIEYEILDVYIDDLESLLIGFKLKISLGDVKKTIKFEYKNKLKVLLSLLINLKNIIEIKELKEAHYKLKDPQKFSRA